MAKKKTQDNDSKVTQSKRFESEQEKQETKQRLENYWAKRNRTYRAMSGGGGDLDDWLSIDLPTLF